MARFILLTIIAFIALTFVFVALKGILRRFIGTAPEAPKTMNDKVLYKRDGVVVLQGDAERKD